LEHSEFVLAGGSVIGRDHRRTFKNYQDGSLIVRNSECTLALVTDGCGSSPHSEVGAQLGARFTADAILDMVWRGAVSKAGWSYMFYDVLGRIRDVVLNMHGSPYRLVEDYFLFTMVGALLYGGEATFFAVGDGVIIVNGELTTLGPFPDNQPPYAGYGLLGKRGLEVQTVKTCPLSGLQHFLIGTDGVSDLIAARGNCLPGMNGQVGPVSQFWDEERYLGGNPDLVSRRLRVIGRDWPKRDPEPGLLPDDTTLIVGRAANS
jgi:hypothetical protein